MERNQFLSQLRSRMPVSVSPAPQVKPRIHRVLTPEERLQLFVERATAALTHIHICTSDDAALSILESIIGASSFVDTGCKRYGHLLQELQHSSCKDLTHDRDVTFGISDALFGVALTGTCVLDAHQHRGGSLLPPCHIIFLDAADIVEDLYAAYAKVGDSLRNSRTSVFAFHTGPSRSADIEQTMALGVHGPGDVHIVLFALHDGE